MYFLCVTKYSFSTQPFKNLKTNSREVGQKKTQVVGQIWTVGQFADLCSSGFTLLYKKKSKADNPFSNMSKPKVKH